MKKITILFLLLSTFTQAQRFDWVSTANSSTGATAIARDSQGNIYTLDAGNSAQSCQGITVNPAGGTSLFLYKFNALGEIIYIKPIGTNFSALNVVIGENDNIYVLGSLMGTGEIQVNGQTFIDTENRNYIFKFNPSGDLIWRVKNNVSFGNFRECTLLLFTNNHIYFQSSGLSISKLNTDGQYVATITADSFSSTTSATAVFFRAGGVLSNGDLVFSAVSRGTITYGSTVLVPTYNQFLHVPFLTLRATQDLNFIWATYTNGLRSPDLNILPMAIGNDNSIYLGLQVSGTVTAGSDTIVSEDTSGTTIGGILKMDADGNKIWVKTTTNNAQTYTILNNPDGSGIFCAGQIYGFSDISLGTTVVNPTNGNSFVSKIDYDGVFQNSFAFASGPGSYAKSLATNNAGVFYVGGILTNVTTPTFSCITREGHAGLYLGKFAEQPDKAPKPTLSLSGNTLTASPVFGGNIQWFLNGTAISGANGQTFTATQTGNYSVTYVLPDYTACVSTSAITVLSALANVAFENRNNSIKVFPNPTTGMVAISSPENATIDKIEVIDVLGKTILVKTGNTSQLDISSFSKGMYIFKLYAGDTIFQKKIVKQ